MHTIFAPSRRQFLPLRSRLIGAALLAISLGSVSASDDYIRQLQQRAIKAGTSPALHWGVDPTKYTEWRSHSNRLVPVYTYGTRGAGPGIDLSSYSGENSPYRSAAELKQIYGRLPTNTLNTEADYFDQTNLAELQRAALAAGRKFIFLVIFDGMDWQTTRAAAIYNSGTVSYDKGHGSGLHFLDYQADGLRQFGFAVASPSNALAVPSPNRQTVVNPGATPGGYNAEKGGPNPWTDGSEPQYLIRDSASGKLEHARPDSASTATAITTGSKTYNAAINVDRTGAQLTTVAHLAQEKGYAVGAVSNVPVSHGTPAATYGHNVLRYDYQDLSRDLLGLPSIAHPEQPLPGLDVLIGGGFGTELEQDKRQGKNFVPGNQFLTKQDLETVNVANSGKYTVAIRTKGVSGTDRLRAATQQAIQNRTRLLGFFGMGQYAGHLPFRTADGDYWPTAGNSGKAEQYTVADVQENPTLTDMTSAALAVLEQNQNGFWLMVEAGDVDWANHDNNIDNSIGAVLSGDAAVKVITDWVDQHSNWSESLLIVTSDHGHFLVIEQPEALTPPGRPQTETAD